MRVPMNDPARFYVAHKAALDEAFQRVVLSGILEEGPELKRLEEDLARFFGTRYAVGVGSGTAALEVALRAVGVGQGDEVITVPNSDMSTTAAISHCGATVVWVDVDDRTYNIAVEQLENRITSRTKAILPVHLYGHPAEMDAIITVASKHGLRVIEDGALAFGGLYHGRRVGAMGDMGCFSFAPSKQPGAYGDGGAVVTNDAELAHRARLFRGYGEVPPEPLSPGAPRVWGPLNYLAEGYHSHLDELQAAFLNVKMPLVDELIGRRQEIASTYERLTVGLPVVHPFRATGVSHTFRTYVIRVPGRDRVRLALAQKGIATGVHYAPPMHLQPVYESWGFGPGSFPVTERVAQELLCLPIFPEITEEEIEEVACALRQAIEEVVA